MTYQTTKLIIADDHQAVLLLDEFRLTSSEVYIYREGSRIVISPKSSDWRDFFNRSERPTEDFMQERVDLPLVGGQQTDVAHLIELN